MAIFDDHISAIFWQYYINIAIILLISNLEAAADLGSGDRDNRPLKTTKILKNWLEKRIRRPSEI